MTRAFLVLIFFCAVTTNAWSNAYFGLNGNYSFFNNSETNDHKVSPKGAGYGALLGVGKEFVGLEAFYQTLTAQGDIKHEGEKGKLDMNASVIGAAIRFSFQSFFLRLGVGNYTLDQSVDLKTEANIDPAEDVYNVHKKGTSKMGVLFGIGVHGKFAIGRLYLDYTRHQIAGAGNYDSIGAGIVWLIPERLFSISKN